MSNRIKLGFWKKLKTALRLLPDLIEMFTLWPYIKLMAEQEIIALKLRIDGLEHTDTQVMRFKAAFDRVERFLRHNF